MQKQSEAQPAADRPRLYTIPSLSKSHGFTRSMIYRSLKAQKLRAIKIGARTYIVGDSVDELVREAPPATFGNKRAA